MRLRALLRAIRFDRGGLAHCARKAQGPTFSNVLHPVGTGAPVQCSTGTPRRRTRPRIGRVAVRLHPAANRAGRGSVLVPVNIIETQTVKKPENGIFAYTVPKKRHPSKTENQGHNPNASFSLRPFCKNETERTCFGKVHFAKAACVFSKRHPNASTCIRFRLDRSWKVEPERMALNPNGSFSRRAF